MENFQNFILEVYSGLQRQPGEIFDDCTPYRASIQTILEKGLQRLNPSNEPFIQFSSRYNKFSFSMNVEVLT